MVISTFNRARLLKRNLSRLQGLTTPQRIIVVDDGGTDDTESVCQEFPQLNIDYIYTNNPGMTLCSHSRNVGVQLTETEWFVTCEPELIFLTDIIAQFCEQHDNHPEEIISAGIVYFQPKCHSLSMDVSFREFETAGDYTPPNSWQRAEGWVAPYVGLWNTEWVKAVGGWDEQFPGAWGWDDIDLLTRLRIDGHNQYIDLEMEAVHQFHGLGGDKDFVNEKYFRRKSFSQGDETQTEDLIANKGISWGEIKPQ